MGSAVLSLHVFSMAQHGPTHSCQTVHWSAFNYEDGTDTIFRCICSSHHDINNAQKRNRPICSPAVTLHHKRASLPGAIAPLTR